MSINSAQLTKKFPELQYGNAVRQTEASHIASCENYANDSLVFCQSESFADAFHEKTPAIIITNETVFGSLCDLDTCILISPDLRLSHALIKQAFNNYDASDPEWPALHPSAIVHESAEIGSNCRIGPNVVIGAKTKIGDNCIIRAGSVVEHDVIIGEDCIINSLCNIGSDTVIGNRVIIRPNSSIGNEGFSFAKDKDNFNHRIPHTGNVVLHDDVQIGASCNIDRGTYGSTTIGRGTKIDGLCHVAHNVVIGENCILVSQCGIAGSTVIGDRAILSGQTGVLDHKFIAADAILVHRCGVTKDIPEKGMWAGTPPKKFKDYVKEQQLVKNVEKLKRQLRDLENKLDKG